MKKFMEAPETKAQLERFQSQDDKINRQFEMAATRVLSKRQAANYKKMLGAPFDLSKIRGGPGQGFFGRNAMAKGAGTTKAGTNNQAAVTPASGDDQDGSAVAKPSPAKSAATSTPSTARPKRKSLRELRGIPDKSSN